MKSVKYFIAYLNLIRLFPHLILFFIHKERCRDDVIANSESTMKGTSIVTRFLMLMVFDKYYRQLFYYRVGAIRYLISFLCPSHNCFFISPTTQIDKGLQLGHPFSSAINAASIGSHCSVFQDVTIGNNGGGRPVIGNNVSIFVNTVIVGNITIGDNVTIGACTFVNKNVPPNCTVVGIPARIVKMNGQIVNIPL